LLSEPFDEAMTYAVLRKAKSDSRPVGSKVWLEDMEARSGLILVRSKRGSAAKFK